MAGEHRQVVILYSDAPRGQCRWCGQPITKPDETVDRRRRWHAECLEVYQLSWPAYARGKLWRRDQGVCAECGTQCRHAGDMPYKGFVNTYGQQIGKPAEDQRPGWHVDHIVELIDGGTHTLDNMQTLCIPCHNLKTADHAGERARVRREEKDGWAGDLFDALKGE